MNQHLDENKKNSTDKRWLAVSLTGLLLSAILQTQPNILFSPAPPPLSCQKKKPIMACHFFSTMIHFSRSPSHVWRVTEGVRRINIPIQPITGSFCCWAPSVMQNVHISALVHTPECIAAHPADASTPVASGRNKPRLPEKSWVYFQQWHAGLTTIRGRLLDEGHNEDRLFWHLNHNVKMLLVRNGPEANTQ